MTKLVVRIVNKYGRLTIYPVNAYAKLFCELLKQTTLTEQDVETIKRLGFEVVQEELKL